MLYHYNPPTHISQVSKTYLLTSSFPPAPTSSSGLICLYPDHPLCTQAPTARRGWREPPSTRSSGTTLTCFTTTAPLATRACSTWTWPLSTTSRYMHLQQILVVRDQLKKRKGSIRDTVAPPQGLLLFVLSILPSTVVMTFVTREAEIYDSDGIALLLYANMYACYDTFEH